MKAPTQRNLGDIERMLRGLWVYVVLPGTALIALLLAAARGYLIGKYAVDIPYWDEWSLLTGLDKVLRGSWLWRLHNEHRIVISKFVVWLLFRMDGWNLITGLWVNYAAFLVIPALIFAIARRDSSGAHWAFVPFLMFFFTYAGVDNDVWGFQIAWRFFVVFLLLAVLLLFDEKQRVAAILAGAFCLVASIFSLASGIPASLALIAVYAGFKLARERAGHPRGREWRELALPVAVVAAGAALWLVGWREPPGHLPLELPTHRLFWSHFFSQVSLAIGSSPASAWTGAGILVGLAIVLVADWWKQRVHPLAGTWRRIGMAAACLAALTSISTARAGFGAAQADASRYFEVALLLLPVLVLSGHAVLERNWRRGYLGFVFLVCWIGFSQRLSEEPYREHGAQLASGVACLQQNLKQGRPLVCGTLFPAPLDIYIERARTLNTSFYRRHLANLR